MPKPRPVRLEIHAHCWVSGPLANRLPGKFDHAHADGDTRHEHPECGPASFTIDRDAWFAATGLVGGGKKKYAKAPTEPLLERVELEEWQQRFKVVFMDNGLTPERERAGVTEAEMERERAAFRAAAAGQIPEAMPGQPGNGGAAVARLVLGADLDVEYVYEDLRGGEPV